MSYYSEAKKCYDCEQYKEAYELYTQGTTAGDEKCFFGIASLLYHGNYVNQDIKKANEIFAEHFDSILEIANNGDAEAMFIISCYYFNGYFVKKNDASTIEWLERAATSGYAIAQNCIGAWYEEGYIVEKDQVEAVKWFKMSADQGNLMGQTCLGNAYEFAKGVAQDFEKAVYWYQQAAEKGDAEGQWKLGYMYSSGKGVEKDTALAVYWYQKSAEQGNSEGQWRLGSKYFLGEGVAENYETAVYWYRKSAEQGNTDGQFHLGLVYYYGTAITKDYNEALKWFEKAAKKGDTFSQYHLGLMYLNGFGVEKNIDIAIVHMKKAAEKNFSKAHNILGMIFENELLSYDNSRLWYEKGVALGNVDAMFNLGSLYEKGIGVEPSLSKAIDLYHKACDVNKDISSEAAYRLGYAYYDGEGVDHNIKQARNYFKLALENGYTCAYALNMVKGELGELDDINKMREYANGLIKKHVSNTKLYQQISNDLQNDFGDTWNITCRETKKFLETGMFTYFSFYSLGPHIYGNMDFSASITPMFKALEKELGKYLYSEYIEFLKKQNISPNQFSQKRSFIKRVGSTEFAYRDPSDLSEFTLGNLHLTVGLEHIPQVAENDTFKHMYMVDQQMLDYLNSIFKEDAFGEGMREREITDYIISLTQEVKSIADSLRNPAAHDQAMKIHKAEVCGNYIIKVQKLLFGFLSKLK